MIFPSIDIQGSIISAELLSKIRSEQANYQQGKDFSKDFSNPKLKDEISAAWQDAKGQWVIFQNKINRLKEGETGTTETRNFWMIPLLSNLGYNLNFIRQAEELNGKSFPISYRDSQIDGFPVYIGGYHESLDRRPENKQLRVSPHAMLQEYLNYSEHLYGLVTNGRYIRLLRDASRITRLSYVEFNLQKMMEEDLYSDFVLLYRLLHVSRMPLKIDGGAESIIEKYHQEGLETGSTIRNKLGDAVKNSIKALANGFLNHPDNVALREVMQNGSLNPDTYYHHQLRIIYRLLFLFVIEERNLVFADTKLPETRRFSQIYHKHYSLLRLRRLARKLPSPDARRHYDLWQSMLDTFSLFETTSQGAKLGIMALQGDIFSYDAIKNNRYDLHKCRLSNHDLLKILKDLAYFGNEQGVLIAVNYGGLDVEEFGSVYEGLLELKLKIEEVAGTETYSCAFDASTERSKSGSHYTPEELVQPLIKHSLEYLIEDRVKEPVSSEWQVVSGKYPDLYNDLRNLIINLSFEYEKLSGFGSLEKGNGFGGTDLPLNSLLSQRRIVWDDFSTPQVSKFYSGKHSRGLGQKRQQGVQPVSEDSQWQSEGNGNPPDAGSTGKTLHPGGDKTNSGTVNNIEQANTFLTTFHLSKKQLTTIWQQLPATIRHSLFATHHLLNLKICDVACGSGHILLSAARRLAIEVARIQTDEEQPNPIAIRKAMKQVVKECIYGVDKNPLAVELCKVALWLEAHNPGETLGFLDHHIKCGDAIVGLAHKEELENGIADEAFKTLPGDDKEVAQSAARRNKQERIQRAQVAMSFEENIGIQVHEAVAEYKRFEALPENSPADIETKQKAFDRYNTTTYKTRLQQLANAQVAQFFIPKTEANKDKLITDAEYRKELARNPKAIMDIQNHKFAYAEAVANEKRFFHWFLEFPEVFDEGGFDCILGNPPFLGNRELSSSFGDSYLNWLLYEYKPAGSVDLVTYFFRRIFNIIKLGGYQSLISTNTISQGGAREGGLKIILENEGTINFAIRTKKWPGLAKVSVSLLSIYKGKWSSNIFLDNKQTTSISSYLDDDLETKTYLLKSSDDLAFQGSVILGDGFVLTPFEATRIIEADQRNKEVIFPFLDGDDLNSTINQTATRWVINFDEKKISEIQEYPIPFGIVKEKVYPQRLQKDKEKYPRMVNEWWKFWMNRKNLAEKISYFNRVLVSARVSKYLNVCFVETNQVFHEKLVVFAFDSYDKFAILQSDLHVQWAWKYRTTLESRLSYTPSDIFQTFPLRQIGQEQQLEIIGEAYHEHRRQLMRGMQMGLTKSYNAFHAAKINLNITKLSLYGIDKKVIEKLYGKEVWNLWNHLQKTPGTCTIEEAVAGIVKLRELHVELDNAVLEAYGWQDIPLRHDFYVVDYLPENDRIRFTIHPDARKEILKRLLELNHKIHAEEVAAGLWDKPKAKPATYKRSAKDHYVDPELDFL